MQSAATSARHAWSKAVRPAFAWRDSVLWVSAPAAVLVTLVQPVALRPLAGFLVIWVKATRDKRFVHIVLVVGLLLYRRALHPHAALRWLEPEPGPGSR